MKNVYLIAIFFLQASCFNSESHHYGTLKNYDLNHPKVHKMPGTLNEISGLAFYKGNSDTIYAEQDERGVVYLLRRGEKGTVARVDFKKNGDFEDIAILNDWVVMLRSDGVLFTFPIQEVRKRKIEHFKVWEDILPKGEYESLHADNATNQLFVLCKECKQDNKKDLLSGFVFHLSGDNHLQKTDEFQINTSKILKDVKESSSRFKPSALTFNPHTKEWYIISNVNKALVVADRNWNVKEVVNLDPKLYIQPEGMAFDNDHTFYISNEGTKIKPGTIFEFEYRTDINSK